MIKVVPPRSTFPIALWWSPLAVSSFLLGRVVSLPPLGFLFVIHSELNRHGISRKRENAEDLDYRSPGCAETRMP